jgi:hypothetical protein
LQVIWAQNFQKVGGHPDRQLPKSYRSKLNRAHKIPVVNIAGLYHVYYHDYIQVGLEQNYLRAFEQ